MTQPETSAQMLRYAHLRVTGPRVAILDTLRAHPHSDADAVAQSLRRSYGKVSTQTVYDALHAMALAGIVRRIEPAGRPALYECRVGDNHHHLVCRRCSTIVDIPCAIGKAPCLTPAHESELSRGFVIDEAEVTYWGLCPQCQSGTHSEETAS